MTKRPPASVVRSTFVGIAMTAGALVSAVPSMADPDVPIPTPIPGAPVPGAPVPGDAPPSVPDAAAGDPVAAPAPGPNLSPGGIPQIANPNYGSGGGLFGTISDLWKQVSNPYYAPGEGIAAPAPPPGAGPAPALPPGYVSTNAPGSETASSTPAGGPATGRPALPPGYYSTSGPPPPGYEYTSGLPGQVVPTTAAPAPPP